jgi:hypothetical protein
MPEKEYILTQYFLDKYPLEAKTIVIGEQETKALLKNFNEFFYNDRINSPILLRGQYTNNILMRIK